MTVDNYTNTVDMDIDIYTSDSDVEQSNELPILEGMKDPEDCALRLDLSSATLKKLREFA